MDEENLLFPQSMGLGKRPTDFLERTKNLQLKQLNVHIACFLGLPVVPAILCAV